MGRDYIEAILVWSENGPSPSAVEWFSKRGLTATPMRAGLLISGDRQTFDAVFSVGLQMLEPPVSLPIPAELMSVVSSITIPKPRRFQESERRRKL